MAVSPKAGRIVVVDDEPSLRESCRTLLALDGHEVITCARGSEAARVLQEEAYDLAILDLYMVEMTGLELLRIAQETSPGVPVIIMTGNPSVETSVAALREGAWDYIPKPFSATQFQILVNTALSESGARPKATQLRDRPQTVTPTNTNSLLPFVLGGFLHDAKNSVASLKISTELLGSPESAEQLGSTEAAALWRAIDLSVRDLARLVEGMRDLVLPFYSAEGDFDEVTRFTEFEEKLRAAISQGFPDEVVELHFSISECPPLAIPEALIWFVVKELVSNSIRAARLNEVEARLWIYADYIESAHTLRAEVEDRSGGFPQGVLEGLRSGGIADTQNSDGGLSLIESLALRLNGQLLARNHPHGGSRVTVLLTVEPADGP